MSVNPNLLDGGISGLLPLFNELLSSLFHFFLSLLVNHGDNIHASVLDDWGLTEQMETLARLKEKMSKLLHGNNRISLYRNRIAFYRDRRIALHFRGFLFLISSSRKTKSAEVRTLNACKVSGMIVQLESTAEGNRNTSRWGRTRELEEVQFAWQVLLLACKERANERMSE